MTPPTGGAQAPPIPALCATCEYFKGHQRRTGRHGGLPWPYCSAFPTGMPEAIARGTAEHRKPWPGGDNGLQYTQRAGSGD